MSDLPPNGGYVCVPYSHNHESIEVKEMWNKSRNVENMYFVTATFSSESQPYFPFSSNHYLLAKFKDGKKVQKDVEKFNQEKTSFIFNMNEDLFEREATGEMNFVSVYYLEYGDSEEDISEVANVVAKRENIGKAGVGNLEFYSVEKPKFTFPYTEQIVILEVSSEKNFQSVNKYCEKTRREVCRKGITMINFASLSILETLK